MQTRAGQEPFGSWFDRELVNAMLAERNLAIWSFSFTDNAVTWVSDHMDVLLNMTGAEDQDVRGRLGALLEPIVHSARHAPLWQELELHQPLPTGEPEKLQRWVGFRARPYGASGQEGLLGVAVDLSADERDAQTVTELANRYRLLVELSPDAVAVHQDGVVRYANPATVALLGASSDADLVGRPVTDFVDARSLGPMHERLSAMNAAEQTTATAEAELTRLDGTVTPVELVSVRTSWVGQPAYQVIMRDLTTRLQAQAELRYQAALVTHVNDAIIATTRDGEVTSWNPAAESIYGLRAEDAIGSPVQRALGIAFDVDDLCAADAPSEQVHQHVDGSQLIVRVSAAAMDEGYVLVCADETARRHAEKNFATVVDALGEAVLVLDKHGMITFANPSAEQLFGRSADEIVGTAGDAWPICDESGRKLSADQRPHHLARAGEPVDNRVIGCDHRWVSCSSRPLTNDGPPYPVVLSLADITERRRHAELLRYQATHDELTGLLNRKGINDLLDKLLCAHDDGRVGLVFCDLDNFKRINDSMGHHAGDELLGTLAEQLRDALPQHCTAGRLSGDEFAIICSDVDAAGGLPALLTWVSEFLRTTAVVRGQLVHVTASAGAAIADGAMSGEDLLRHADAAMFHAKGTGRGRATIAEPEILTAPGEQLQLEEHLHEALDSDQLQLHYQPITDENGDVVMAEALLRWPHPERGMLSPGAILPVAQQAGLLHDLDTWVLSTALRHAESWPGDPDNPVSVAINLGSHTPDQPGFTEKIDELISSSGLAPQRIVLEMVETAVVDLSDAARQAMTKLSARGLRFALDDFGTGYSSLARLKDLPAHILKLDRHFVANLEHNPRDRALAHGVITLGHAMGHEVVAEGVETRRQHEQLRHLGADLYQGFLLHRPMPAETLHDVLRAREGTPRQRAARS
jgi:diguanylate cyclase (GGDEF)-like protein/PAS domain S-box-containing protein